MDEADFTEEHYRAVLRRAQARYAFATFDARPTEPHVLWRHDIDMSPHRALAVARIEADEGVVSTYCVLLHSEFYNLLESAVTERIREIIALGHRLGLHFDAGFCSPRDVGDLAEALSVERRILEQTFDCPVNVFSFHNGDFHDMLRFDADEIAGMVNAYGRGLFSDYEYISDSNGYWRFRRLMDVVDKGESDLLYVLTHPEWWQAQPMSPDDRVKRAITGRGRAVRSNFDQLLSIAGRRSSAAPNTPADRVLVRDILTLLPSARPLGDALRATAEIHRPAPLADAATGTITFIGSRARALPREVSATMVIVDEAVAGALDLSQWSVDAVVASPSARLDFIRVVQRFFAPPRPRGIDPSAEVATGAVIDEDVYIGPRATVAAGVEIGAGSVLHAGVHVCDGTRIGRQVTIQAGAVIGAEGFGFERDEDGRPRIFPHLGGVVIGDYVGIGANACIDRGTLGDTVIGPGTQIDNLVHISHNVEVGASAVVIAHAFVGGGARIGARSWIAPGAVVRDGIEIGEDALVGMGAVVIRNVPDGVTVMAVPARSFDAGGGTAV